MNQSTNGHRPYPGDAFTDYLADISVLEQGKKLSDQERKEIERLASQGDIRSRQRLVVISLRYVLSVARKFYFAGSMANMEPVDVIQEGNSGLLQAAITFRHDHGSGISFLGYASSRIEGQIKDAIRKNITGKGIPRRFQDLNRRIVEATFALYDVFKREPTNEELANHLQVDPKEVSEATRLMALLTKAQLSIESTTGSDGEDRASLEEVIEDIQATDPLESAARREEQKKIRAILNDNLDPRQRLMVALAFNLTDDRRVYTMKELGIRFGVSESRACQIVNRALEKLGGNPQVQAWFEKLPKLDQNIRTTLTVFEMERRKEEKERRSILNGWKERTILFEDIKEKAT